MENIRLLVQEEGRTARNLIAFNVPVIETQCDQGKVMRKPPTSPKPHLESRLEEAGRLSKRTCESTQTGSRVRSASTGRDKKSELHARYWAFLFGNLQRAVDEIYQTCESDESVTECKEVIMVLDNYTREFRNLIDWFKIKWEYENTPPPQRPRSLAWEIRKSSPGKIRPNILTEPLLTETNKDHLNGSSLFRSNNETSKSDLVELHSSPLNTVSENPPRTNEVLLKINEDLNCNSTVEETNKLNCINNEEVIPEVLERRVDIVTSVSSDATIIPDIVSDVVMVDEVCQTDREEDVDENGPKYRNSAQQTCPILSGLDQCDTGVLKNAVSNKTNSEHGKLVVKIDNKEKLGSVSDASPKEDNSLSTVTMKSGVVKSVSNLVTAKTPTKTLLSSTPGSQVKSSPIQNISKANLTSRVVKSASIGPSSSSLADRQPWGARPSSAIPPRHSLRSYNSTSSTLQRWPKTKVVPEARSCGDSCRLAAKSTRSALLSKQDTNSKLKQAKYDNLARRRLSSLTASQASSQGMTNSAEALAPEIAAGDEEEEADGWVKVRSRNRFSPATKAEGLETTLSRSACNLKINKTNGNIKMTPKTRFNQPSSALSLPTLALLEGDSKEKLSEDESKENETCKKTNRAKIESKSKAKENQKPVKKTEKNKISDTNNKLRSSDKSNRKSLNPLGVKKFCPNRDAALTERIENIKNKSGSNFPSKTILIDQDGVDEDENQFDEEIKKNKETEEMLQKEIHELQSAEIEVDTETGDEETDGETPAGTEEEPECNAVVKELERKSLPRTERHYEKILNGMTWADHQDALDELEKLVVQDCSGEGMTKDEQKDTLERLEELVARHPGRALELHQKLSSPSRRRTIPDTVKRFQARQAKAYEKREQLKMEKAQKLRELLKKVDEVKAAKDKLIEDKRQRLEMKLKRAAENRNLHLKEIMRKAHDEEEKLKEIAFINELEAQNKRHDFMTQCQEQEDRLQGIHEERQRKQEEKAAKEAAVEERRKALEAERQVKLEKMQERQRKRDEQADKKKQEKEKERQELAREKARDRSERLEALHAAQLEAQEELQKKIQQKQEEYARRHEENIEQIRQKALELSILKCSDDVAPKLAPYETQKLCTACNVLIVSEVYLLSHLRGRKHQEAVKNQNGEKDMSKEEVERYNLKIIVNAPADKIDSKMVLERERAKSFKKKCKKIRLRMNAKGEEYLSKLGDETLPESQNKIKLKKCLKDITRIMDSQGKGRWNDNAVTALERAMGEIRRTFEKEDLQDKEVFRSLNGFSILCRLLQLDIDIPSEMPPFLPQNSFGSVSSGKLNIEAETICILSFAFIKIDEQLENSIRKAWVNSTIISICYVSACTTFLAAINNSVNNAKYIVASNKIATLLDILLKHLVVLVSENGVLPSSTSALPVDPIANAMMRLIAKILSLQESESEEYVQRLQDVISYTVSVGIVDKLSRYCKSVRDPIDDDISVAQFLLNTIELLTMLTKRCKCVRKGNEDPTQLLITLQATELIGAISILYGMLLHQGTPSRLTEPVPPALPPHTVSVALATIRLLRSVAELDLQMFQRILGAEGISLQFRHIASYLLWYCCQDKEKDLLHEVVSVVGFFAVQNRDNQMILQSGSMPTVLQQLCNLPFPYFSNPELSALLYPTLLACCHGNEENRAILEQEISYWLLEDFLQSNSSDSNPLLSIIRSSEKKKETPRGS